MASVYSTQLAAQVHYSGTLDILVPSGYKLVVRDIDVALYGGGGASQFAFFGNIGNLLWFANAGAGAAVAAAWRGRQVFEPGQMFQLLAGPGAGSVIDFQCSGYKLLLP